ncbi:MAG: sugar ABC transporter permease [Henriciella sp.]|nr:sugar ABC transporter permease [Henriciella sp.]
MKSCSAVRGFISSFVNGPWPWLIPALGVLLLFRGYPLGNQFWLAMTDMKIASGDASFVGFENFSFLFSDPNYLTALGFTILFTSFSVFGSFVLGFGLALMLNRRMTGRVIYRMGILTTWAISSLIVGYIWRLMLNESSAGVLNGLLEPFGIGPVPWLSDPNMAQVSVIVADIWRSTGFTMIFMLGGLQTLPSEVLEAAKMDGAKGWQTLLYIVMPLLKPLIAVALIFSTIATFNVYELVLALSSGGPGNATSTVGFEMYRTAFGDSMNAGLGLIGRGAAMGVSMFLVTLMFALIYIRAGVFARDLD